MKRRGVVRFGVLALSLVPAAGAHDLITAEAAERYANEASRHVAAIGAHGPARQRSEASVALGRLLDEVRELLNRDLAVHGRVQGLPSNYIVAELKARGAPLRFDTQGNRFLAHVDYYRDALRLDPDGPFASEARFRWLRGAFYDSFEQDPVLPRGQSFNDFEEQIRLGEPLLAQQPAFTDIEEVRFILLIYYVRAARAAPSPPVQRAYAARARSAAADFQSRHAESLRAAALPVLLSTLP